MTQQMTAEQATQFDGHSTQNALIVAMALEERGCTSCLPYQDVFTYNRWKAQGFQVQKGEESIHITTYVPTFNVDKNTGEKVQTGKRPRTSCVFCRHQVKAIEKKEPH